MQDLTIMKSNEAKSKFIELRNKVENLIAKTPIEQLDEVFAEEFSRIYTEATYGDIVCQDYLGYIFKRGRHGLVPENFDLSMKWLILSASNGNDFSIDRLSIFLNRAYDEIVYLEDFPLIKAYNDIDENNYTYVIGRLICDALVDYLKIDALNIIKEIPDILEFSPSIMHMYENARSEVIPTVVKYLRSNYQNNNQN